jgi:hypothetical protein
VENRRGVFDGQIIKISQDHDSTLPSGQRSKGRHELVWINSHLRLVKLHGDFNGCAQHHFRGASAQVAPAVLGKVRERTPGIGLRLSPGGVPPATRS